MMKLLLPSFFALLFAMSPLFAAQVYVTNFAGDNVTAIDTQTDTSTGDITVESGPRFMALTLDGTKVYVTNRNSNSVSVIETATNTVLTTIGGITQASPILMLPNGETVYAGGNLLVGQIDVATDTAGPNIVIDGRSLALVATPDSAKLYSLNESNNVNVIDTATGTVSTTIVLVGSDSVISMAITPNGDKIYVVDGNTDQVFVIDTATDTVIDTIAVGSTPLFIAITPDGTKAYVSNGNSNNISVIDIASDTVIATVSIVAPTRMTSSPDGGEIYVSTNGTNLGVLDTATDTIVETINVGVSPQWTAFTPDGGKAYVPISSGVTQVIDTATRTIIATVAGGPSPFFALFVPSAIDPPSDGSGRQQTNKFATQSEYYNVITWTEPSQGEPPVSYRIYSDAGLTDLLGTVPASGPLAFIDHNVRPGVQYTYYIVSVSGGGEESDPIVITVP